MKRLFYSISVLLVLTPALLLLGSIGTAYVSPAKINVLAFAGFGFTLLWLLNLVLALWLLIRRSFWIIIPLLALAASWSHWNNTFQISSRSTNHPEELGQTLKVMSYNTRMFDYYGHSGLEGTPQRTYDDILRQGADLLCFQEYYTNLNKKDFTPTAIAAKFRGYPHKHIHYATTHQQNTGYGLAIFSKYPLVDQGVIPFEHSRNMAIYADVKVGETTIRVFSVHLESIGFQDNDLNVLDSLDFRMTESQKQGLVNISRKLTRAFKMRSSQAETLARHIKNAPYPVIVCGDFNDTPVSYVYRTMRGKLKDAFVESGSGFGATYNGRLPSLRIDYIFHDPAFKSWNFETLPLPYSDHHPIMTTLDLKPQS